MYIVPFPSMMNASKRETLNGHSRGLLWFTGFSGSGKSTLAHALEMRLLELGVHCYVLDGDNIRRGLNSDLGLSPEDRKENIRRTVEVAKLMVNAGLLVLAAFITPFQESRKFIRQRLGGDPYFECYVKCSLQVCAQRDPKCLYQRARQGEITEMTGISAPYEEPTDPDLIIESDRLTVDEATEALMQFLVGKKLILIPVEPAIDQGEMSNNLQNK